ncbi:MAG: hypothetical protein COV74_09825 [Candidatus Omnitrophica bacterium CG11_big_fil_rev_8_21_14_0_20_45_26]|uniref:Methyltransferase type 12 n=1 Tax=Candidatus Abzuiibacterium crystallinum TaxID=1974748 RepID=A0A2H0LP26_9BACT|nr:MAG: hypothetical protein COV74_09825 [Candidatus Omnitrophica bacterium CG11_big_fil_rev_8_21_14_0_20_45_26]PIW64504.1 MAG: hypothetical protein COW12_05950 [Candidatus Omnitrophica bacterium CG12_big_fil_rev_8_21_14_0_65_45_16]
MSIKTAGSLMCPICEHAGEMAEMAHVPYPTLRNSKGVSKPEQIYFCSNCEAGTVFPPMTDAFLSQLYDNGVFWQSKQPKTVSPRQFPVLYGFSGVRWQLMKRFFKNQNISILDIGAGHGFFGMQAASDRDIQLDRYVMVESDETLTHLAQSVWQKQFPQVQFEAHQKFESSEGFFDVVALSHVLEHIPQPRPFLGAVIQKLKPGGWLFIDVPNQDYRFKKDVFPHVTFFNPRSLKTLLTSLGLEIETLNGYGNQIGEILMSDEKESHHWLNLIFKLSMKMAQFLPTPVLIHQIRMWFGAGQINDSGMWIRAIAKPMANTP